MTEQSTFTPDDAIKPGMQPQDSDFSEEGAQLPPIMAPDDPRWQDANWGYTRHADYFAQRNGLVDQYGRYAGTPYYRLDRHGNQFDMTVDYRSLKMGGEVSYVDLGKEGARYYTFFDNFIKRVRAVTDTLPHGKDSVSERVGLSLVFDSVRKDIEYSKPFTENVINDIHTNPDLYPHNLVPLHYYLPQGTSRGKGVCRHMAYAAALLGTKAHKHGELHLPGAFEFHNNSIAERGGHAWVRYKSPDGTDYIIDPAQNFMGTLDEVYLKIRDAQDRGKMSKVWDYFLPDEKKKYQARFAADTALKNAAHQNQSGRRIEPETVVVNPDLHEFQGKSKHRAMQAVIEKPSRVESLPNFGVTIVDIDTATPLVSAATAKEVFNLRGDIVAAVMVGSGISYVVRSEQYHKTGHEEQIAPVNSTPRGESSHAELLGPQYALAVISDYELQRGWELAHGQKRVGKDAEDQGGYFPIRPNEETVVGRDNRVLSVVNGGARGLTSNTSVSKKHVTITLDTSEGKNLLKVRALESINQTVVLSDRKK